MLPFILPFILPLPFTITRSVHGKFNFITFKYNGTQHDITFKISYKIVALFTENYPSR